MGSGGAAAFEAQVTDATTGADIAGATIVAVGQRFETGKDGRADPGQASGTIFVRAPGYRARSFNLPATPTSTDKFALVPFMPKPLYLSAYGVGSTSLMAGALALVRSGAVNALVINTKGDDGLIPYPSHVPITQLDCARRITTVPDLLAFVQRLHKQGIYLIARSVVFKDNPLGTSRPDLAVHTANGALFRDRKSLARTDPFRPAV